MFGCFRWIVRFRICSWTRFKVSSRSEFSTQKKDTKIRTFLNTQKWLSNSGTHTQYTELLFGENPLSIDERKRPSNTHTHTNFTQRCSRWSTRSKPPESSTFYLVEIGCLCQQKVQEQRSFALLRLERRNTSTTHKNVHRHIAAYTTSGF